MPGLQPAGYLIVSTTHRATANRLSYDIAACPKGKVLFSGGMYVASSSVKAYVADMYPEEPDTWVGEVDNESSSATAYTVFAVCGTKPAAYSYGGSQEVTVNGHTYQGDMYAPCPKGKPLGGGLAAIDGAVGSVVNSSYPEGNGWRVDLVNHGSSFSVDYPASICGTLSGYHVVTASASNPAGHQTGVTALCDTGVPVGGGVYSNSAALTVGMNSSYPVPGGWRSYENNPTTANRQMTAYAVCAT